MPEVCEVALTSQILHQNLVGSTITKLDFIDGKYKRTNPKFFEEFKQALPLVIKKISSKGKFLWFALNKPNENNSSYYIWNTFGLKGMWSFNQLSSTKLVIETNNNIHKCCYYSDTLGYGTFKFSND